jgi:hypothetical protein
MALDPADKARALGAAQVIAMDKAAQDLDMERDMERGVERGVADVEWADVARNPTQQPASRHRKN